MLKKSLFFCTMLLVCNATFAGAGETGWYLGLQGGYADTDYDKTLSGNFVTNHLGLSGTTVESKGHSGAVGRAYLGYQFYRYLAGEIGYSYFQPYKFNNLFGISGADAQILQKTGDILLKPILPLSQQFDLFALAGGAYVYAKGSLNTSAKDLSLSSHSKNSTQPVYGIGAELYFQQYWSVDLSWRDIYAPNNASSGSTKVNSQITMLGISYHFHDEDADNYY